MVFSEEGRFLYSIGDISDSTEQKAASGAREIPLSTPLGVAVLGPLVLVVNAETDLIHVYARADVPPGYGRGDCITCLSPSTVAGRPFQPAGRRGRHG